MKKTLFFYLVEEQLAPFFVGFLGLTTVLLTGRLLQLTRYLFTSSLTVSDLVELMAYALPKLMLFALPMATLMGVLLAFVRLSGDNELIALKAAGVSATQFLPATFAVLLFTTAIAYMNTIYLIPSSSQAFEQKLKSIGKVSLPAFLKEGTFIDIVPNLVFFFKSVNPANLTIEGVFAQDQRQQDVRLVIVAQRAQILVPRSLNQLIFKMSDGIITRVPDTLKDAQAITFKSYDLTLSLDDIFSGGPGKSGKGKRLMNLTELYHLGYEVNAPPKARLPYALELQQRLALPLGCLFLGLIGPPLGALFRQRSRMTGITLGLSIYLAYYVVLSAGKGMGENGVIPAFAAMWTANLLSGLLALYLWVKTQRETPMRWLVLLDRIRGAIFARREAGSAPSGTPKD
ncbi:MAG: LptF/LptG family permease [Syntrophobacteraceae bacterium]